MVKENEKEKRQGEYRDRVRGPFRECRCKRAAHAPCADDRHFHVFHSFVCVSKPGVL
jgi:hypothetical protein